MGSTCGLRFLIRWSCLVVFQIVLLFGTSAGQKGKPSRKPIPSREEHGFRVVPWCINGADEPEFQKYPLTEFKPFLDRDFKFSRGNDAFKYNIDLYKVQIEGHTLGNSDYLENTAHFQFKAERRRDYNISVITDFEETPLEGLIVQAVFAPLGVGLPTGTFLHPEDINCFDCQYPLGQPVGCKKKTWLNFMHPTVLVYHHRMKTTKVEQERTDDFCQDLKFGKYCGGIVPPLATPTVGACERDAVCVAPATCDRPKNFYICYQRTAPPIPIIPEKSCTEIVATNNVMKPKLCDPPKGVSFDPPHYCGIKVQNLKEVTCKSANKYYGRSSEVHGNFVWFTHPCHYTRRIRFIYLAVHSFSKGVYSIVQSGEYNLPDIKGNYQNKRIPSPIFTGFRHRCEPPTPKNEKLPMGDKLVEKIVSAVDTDLTDFDFSVTYDACIRNQGDGVQNVYCMYNSSFDNVPHVAPSVAHKMFYPPSRCFTGQGMSDDKIWDLTTNTEVAKCEARCKEPQTTTIGPDGPPKVPFIKRSFHGGINFVTNFCIMPITVFIARFYKETFNRATFKGGKSWYWMHLIGSGGSSVLMYVGYFHRNYVHSNNPHVIFGNFYIITLAIAYVSSWMRHQSPRITAIAEIVHGSAGYCCFALALCCMHSVPDLGIYPMIFVYCSCFALGMFYLGMTCHICVMDKKFGMQPRRRHFPTIETRFAELPVPKSHARKLSLIILTLTVLPLTLGTIVF